MNDLLAARREVGEFKKRYAWMALVALAVFATLFVRVVQLQVVDYVKYAGLAKENITKTITLSATRGIIRDSKGKLIATNRPTYNVYVTPQLIDIETDVPRIAELMDLSLEQRNALMQRLTKIPPSKRMQQMVAFTDISRDQLAALETHTSELPGVDVVAVPARMYVYKSLGAHAIGYLNEVNADDLKRLKVQGYRTGDKVGRSGIERAWESYLRGRNGYRKVLVDVRGRLHHVETLKNHVHQGYREPVAGRDLVLSLDIALMEAIERAFRGQPAGAVVVVDVHTGRVRALYSKPSYDLNEMSGRLTPERVQELESSPLRPLIDKTLYESYFPGSTFKPISAISALQDNILAPSYKVDCHGFYNLGNRRFRCIQAHGEVNIERALVQSCNVYFYKLAEQVGLDRLAFYAREFGFGTKTGIGINTETNGFIPTKDWYLENYGPQFRVGFTLNAAIGQGNTRVTLIQLTMAYATLANGGTLFVPQLVERVSAPDGTTIEEFAPRVRRKINVTPENIALVNRGLKGVVNDKEGTAYEVRIPDGIPIAGKTGTAQITHHKNEKEDPKLAYYQGRAHAWFAGFAPADAPEVAIAVLVEHGGGGGKNAAPIAIQILQEYLGAHELAGN